MQLKPNRQQVPASQQSVFPDHHLYYYYYYYYYYFLYTPASIDPRLKWLCVDFIFIWEGLTEENGVMSLKEHAD